MAIYNAYRAIIAKIRFITSNVKKTYHGEEIKEDNMIKWVCLGICIHTIYLDIQTECFALLAKLLFFIKSTIGSVN